MHSFQDWLWPILPGSSIPSSLGHGCSLPSRHSAASSSWRLLMVLPLSLEMPCAPQPRKTQSSRFHFARHFGTPIAPAHTGRCRVVPAYGLPWDTTWALVGVWLKPPQMKLEGSVGVTHERNTDVICESPLPLRFYANPTGSSCPLIRMTDPIHAQYLEDPLWFLSEMEAVFVLLGALCTELTMDSEWLT